MAARWLRQLALSCLQPLFGLGDATKFPVRRGGRVAEGGSLLNCCRGSTLTVSSNLISSAISKQPCGCLDMAAAMSGKRTHQFDPKLNEQREFSVGEEQVRSTQRAYLISSAIVRTNKYSSFNGLLRPFSKWNVRINRLITYPVIT